MSLFRGLLSTLAKDIRRPESYPFAIGFASVGVLGYWAFGNDASTSEELRAMTWRNGFKDRHHGDAHGDTAGDGGAPATH
mmetsp:Transcript_23711/g.57898  ORF Transcript_23711/g.57898 Transcript_23711/m.57898 type:complete len:80 (+) Transcript_23711:91-330(+)